MKKRLKRRGNTVTFSVSVDLPTKKLLREVADRSYHGNVSELIGQLARQAARQEAAGEFLAMQGRRPMTQDEIDTFERQIAEELARQRPPRKGRRRAA